MSPLEASNWIWYPKLSNSLVWMDTELTARNGNNLQPEFTPTRRPRQQYGGLPLRIGLKSPVPAKRSSHFLSNRKKGRQRKGRRRPRIWRTPRSTPAAAGAPPPLCSSSCRRHPHQLAPPSPSSRLPSPSRASLPIFLIPALLLRRPSSPVACSGSLLAPTHPHPPWPSPFPPWSIPVPASTSIRNPPLFLSLLGHFTSSCRPPPSTPPTPHCSRTSSLLLPLSFDLNPRYLSVSLI